MAEIRRNLDNEFALRRDKALREAEQRRKEISGRIPELSALDDKISLEGIRYAKALLSDKANPAGSAGGNSAGNDGGNGVGNNASSSAGGASGSSLSAERLAAHINQMKKRKEELLLAHNLPADYLEPHFTCSVCQDRGYITDGSTGSTVPCSCYQKLYMRQLYSFSNLLDDGQTGFDFFKDTYFSDGVDEAKYHADISPREQIRSIKSFCLKFIENFGQKETQSLYFFGPTGTGKTFIAKSTGLELIKKGYTVLYLSAPVLFSIIHRYRLNPEPEESENGRAYKNLISSNLLILDDLGTEPGSDARYAELLTLIEMRKAADKNHAAKTIIASNLDLKRLFEEYNERIASRIVGEFSTLRFIGDDIRIIRKIRNQGE